MRGRTDLNQSEIVRALMAVGATVTDLSQVGGGCPDLLVGFQHRNYLLEVKRDDKPIRLTTHQKIYHEAWRGKVHIIQTVPEALQAIGVQVKG